MTHMMATVSPTAVPVGTFLRETRYPIRINVKESSMHPVRTVLLTASLLVSAAALSQSEPVRAQPGSSAAGPYSTTFAARAVARGPRGGVVVRGPRGVAVRGPHGGVAARGYRVGGRYYGGIWYGTGRRYWRGRWWPYGVGSCWRPSPIGYVWVCG
jgi:hypothetical protein